MTFAQRFGTALLVVATTAWAMFTVLVAGGSGQLELWPYRLVYDGMAVVATIPWLIAAAFRRDWLPSSRLVPAIAAILTAFAIATVTSRVPRLSAEMLGYAILLAELYLLLVVLMRGVRLRAHFERLALGLCLLVCVQYLLQVFQSWQLWWGVVGRLTIPPLRPAYLGLSLGSPNPIATLVLLLGAFSLATIRLRGRVRWVVSSLLLVPVAVTTLVTGSRGAWLGAGAGLVICALAIAYTAPATSRKAIAFLRTRLGAAAVVTGLAALVAAGLLAAITGRLTLEGTAYRESFAAASLRMFESSPLVGIGPGVWQVLRASYAAGWETDVYVPHAHNIYLQTLAEFGVVGIIAGLVVVASVAKLLLGAIRSDDETRRRVGLATLFGVIVLAGQQLVDMLMNVPALLLALAIPLAWLDATAPEPAPEPAGLRSEARRPPRRVLARTLVIAMAAITLIVGAGLFRIETIAVEAEEGVQQANAGLWAEAIAPAGNAAANDSSVTSHWFEVGVAAANAGDLATAAYALGRSAAADDYCIAWVDLAAVRWRLGDDAGAHSALARAERLGLQRVPVDVAAGWLRWQLGDRTAAITDYALAILQAPTLANDPFWSSTPELSAARPAILDKLWQYIGPNRSGAPLLFELKLLAGEPAAAEAALAPLSAADRALYEQAADAWQGLPGAEAALQQLAERNPLAAAPATWCQLVAARHNEPDLVARYGAWLADGFAGGAPIARVTFGEPIPQPNGGVDRYSSLYRQPVPEAQIVGILPQIEYLDHF
ncbi:MAG: O-antigen ligase family protein [Candidatus Limnocylindrales bacterium]|jgi:O-antigen ligase